MNERLRTGASAAATAAASNPVMEHDLSPRKTMVVLVIVVGCFAVLWPKVFYPMYPMLVGSAVQHMKPSSIDKTTGCCDVYSESDMNTIKIMSELCRTIITKSGESGDPPALSDRELVQNCRRDIYDTCGIDISAVLQQQIRLGQSVRQILDEVRSLNGSLCLKHNFGVAPWSLGVPHRIIVAPSVANVRQERPLHLRSELIHPAFRERGRAIPQASHVAPPAPARPTPSRVIEGRPGPVVGLRPTMGGAGHVVPPPKQATSSMSVIMPIYTIGIVIFFTYTLMKILFKKPDGSLYPPIEPDPHFRQEVFESEKARLAPRLTREHISTKLGDTEMDQLRKRLRETESAMERIVEQMSKVPLKDLKHKDNGSLSNGSAVKPSSEEEHPHVTVMGMETTASCEGGQKWSRPDSPVMPPVSPTPEPAPPPQEIYLEGALPAQSHLLVADSATESSEQSSSPEDPAVVLSGKVTLSVVTLDQSENNGPEVTLMEKITQEESRLAAVEKEVDSLIEAAVKNIVLNEPQDSVINELLKELEEEIPVTTAPSTLDDTFQSVIQEPVIQSDESREEVKQEVRQDESKTREKRDILEEQEVDNIEAKEAVLTAAPSVEPAIESELVTEIKQEPLIQLDESRKDEFETEEINREILEEREADFSSDKQRSIIQEPVLVEELKTTSRNKPQQREEEPSSIPVIGENRDESVVIQSLEPPNVKPEEDRSPARSETSDQELSEPIKSTEVLTEDVDALGSDEEVVDEIEEVVYESSGSEEEIEVEVSEEEEEEEEEVNNARIDDFPNENRINGDGSSDPSKHTSTSAPTVAENDISEEELTDDDRSSNNNHDSDEISSEEEVPINNENHLAEGSDVDL